MPLYEYECDACHHRFEVIRKFSDPPVEKCPSCGGMVHKLQSAPAIQFKGAGFYITDYAKKEHTAAAKADSEGGSSDSGAGSKEGSKDGSKDAASKDAASKDGNKAGSTEKTEKKVSSEKGSSTGDSAKSSSPAPSTTSKE